MKCQISFEPSDFSPVVLEDGESLSENLTAENSPVLFGCRTGICGTCAIEVLDVSGDPLMPRTEEETLFLETLAPENPRLRLACQIRLNTNIKIRPARV